MVETFAKWPCTLYTIALEGLQLPLALGLSHFKFNFFKLLFLFYKYIRVLPPCVLAKARRGC